MEPFVVILLLVFAFALARVLAPPREVTKEQRYAKLREQSYARWYAAQLRIDAAAREKADAATYRPHRAVNLLPTGYVVGER